MSQDFKKLQKTKIMNVTDFQLMDCQIWG